MPLQLKAGRRKRRGGFTLVEAAVGVLLTGMLFAGAITLYVSACRTAAGANTQNATSANAANALGRINDAAREAYYIDLPDDTASASPSSFAPFGTYTVSDFKTTVSGQTFDTCIQLTYPTTAAVTLLNSSGLTLAVSPVPYARLTGSGSKLYIYRSDAAGVPKPADGQYLWLSGKERGATSSVSRMLVRLSDGNTAALGNAVQFVRPLDSGGGILLNQVEMRLISSALSPVNGTQTSEGAQSLLTGKCVLMRNHE